MTMEQKLKFVARHFASGYLDPERAWRRFIERTGIGGIRRYHSLFIAAAAIAALVITVGTFFYLNRDRTEYILADSARTVVLPDGSKIDLSPEASLSFRSRGFRRQRKIALTGKAFCQIAGANGIPFDVEFGYGLVRVLGTSFFINVTDSLASIDVFSGRVLLGRTADAPDAMELTGGMHAELRREAKVFRFEDAPLEDVLSEIGAWFGISLKAPESGRRLTGEFEATSPDEILALIESALDIKIER